MEEITQLINRVRRGRDEEAVAELWQVYHQRLVGVARRKLVGWPKRFADEEGVVWVRCQRLDK